MEENDEAGDYDEIPIEQLWATERIHELGVFFIAQCFASAPIELPERFLLAAIPSEGQQS